MQDFKDYIVEDKNTHLEHLEDEIINNGSAGAKTAIEFLKSIKQMLQGGSIITFIIKENKAFQFMNALNIFDISNNLGDTKSLVTHPATTTHRIIGEEGRKKLNISDTMIRLSIGLEDKDDLLEDIDQAFKQVI